MLDYIKNLLTSIFESRQNLDRELLMLAKTEFKDDWEYHYQKLFLLQDLDSYRTH